MANQKTYKVYLKHKSSRDFILYSWVKKKKKKKKKNNKFIKNIYFFYFIIMHYKFF
jgi:hypothetical protein